MSLASMSAEFCSSSSTMSMCPSWAATCSGVRSTLVRASRLIPERSNTSAVWWWPYCAAKCRGEVPSCHHDTTHSSEHIPTPLPSTQNTHTHTPLPSTQNTHHCPPLRTCTHITALHSEHTNTSLPPPVCLCVNVGVSVCFCMNTCFGC